MDPTLTYYQTVFIPDVMGISTTYLSYNSPAVLISYNMAITLVNLSLKSICPSGIDPTLPSLYALAVYNFAAHNLLMFSPDKPGVIYKTVDGQAYGFFAWTRKQLNLTGFTSGVIQSTNDLTTGGSYVVPDAFKNFSVRDLQMTKTIYGQQYLAIAQDMGENDWGIS